MISLHGPAPPARGNGSDDKRAGRLRLRPEPRTDKEQAGPAPGKGPAGTAEERSAGSRKPAFVSEKAAAAAAEALLEITRADMRCGSPAKAKGHCTELLDLEGVLPTLRVKALVYRGLAEYRMGEEAAAMADLDRAVAVADVGEGHEGCAFLWTKMWDGPLGWALLHRAILREVARDYGGAREDFARIGSLGPDASQRLAAQLLVWGNGMVRSRNLRAALDVFGAVVSWYRLPPEFALPARGARGRIRWTRGDVEGALGDLNAVIKTRKAPPEVRQPARASRAEILYGTGDYPRAAADLDVLIEGREGPVFALEKSLAYRARCRLELGDDSGALEDLNPSSSPVARRRNCAPGPSASGACSGRRRGCPPRPRRISQPSSRTVLPAQTTRPSRTATEALPGAVRENWMARSGTSAPPCGLRARATNSRPACGSAWHMPGGPSATSRGRWPNSTA